MIRKFAIICFTIFGSVLVYKNWGESETNHSQTTKQSFKKQELVNKANQKNKRPIQKTPNSFFNKGSQQAFETIGSRKEEDSLTIDSKYRHHQLPGGELIVTKVVVQDGLLIGHGDIIVGREEDLKSIKDGSKPLTIPKPKLWEKGVIPYNIQSNLSNHNSILRAMEYMEKETPIRFKKRNAEKDYITFKEGSANCYSNLGKIGGEQFIALAPGCEEPQIVHEIMHALGFLHEQNRSDRDQYIRILWENIDESNWLQFQIIENSFFDLTKFPFDFKSLMLYPSTSFSMFPDDYSMVDIDGDPFKKYQRDNLLSTRDLERVKYYYGAGD